MTTLQEYLNKNYPTKEEREKVEDIDVYETNYSQNNNTRIIIISEGKKHDRETNLASWEGCLNLNNFPNLKKLKIQLYDKIDKLILENCKKLDTLCVNKKVFDFDLTLDLTHNPDLRSLFVSGYASFKLRKILLHSEAIPKLKKEIVREWKQYTALRDHGIYQGTLVKNIRQFIDISDLDEWVENYDFNKAGDREYHQFIAKQAFYPILCGAGIDNVSNKILARCLIVQSRLMNGVVKNYEESINEYSEGRQLCAIMKAGDYTYEEAQEAVNKALEGDIELLSRLQDLPYLAPEFNFSKNPQLVLKEINQLKEELEIEREEIARFQEKSAEYSLKQIEEIKKRDKEIEELKQKVPQLEIKIKVENPPKKS